MNKDKPTECISERADREVPYFVHEGIVARLDRMNRRLWMLNIIKDVIIVVIIGVFMWYLNQYDYESYTVSSKDGGYASYIGNDGDIYNNGNSKSTETNEKERGEGQSNT